MPDSNAALVATFINGNLTDAKRLGRCRSHRVLRQAYQDATGCSDMTAVAFADYIKGDISFGEFCSLRNENGDR